MSYFRLNLQSWLPTELHPEINHMLVGFGQVKSFSQRLLTNVILKLRSVYRWSVCQSAPIVVNAN